MRCFVLVPHTIWLTFLNFYQTFHNKPKRLKERPFGLKAEAEVYWISSTFPHAFAFHAFDCNLDTLNVDIGFGLYTRVFESLCTNKTPTCALMARNWMIF